MLIFMRHAERGDNEFPQISSSLPYDPPLTNLSPATIKKSCAELSEMLKSNGISKIKIITSKFLRCLMTTEKVSQQLKRSGFIIQDQYEIRGQISQFLRRDWFEEYPMQKLVYDKEQIKQYLQNPSAFILKEQAKLQFPQTYLQFHERVGQFYEQLPAPHPHTAILYVTHGFVVREIIWRMKQVIDIEKEIAYAGWIAYRKGLPVASKL